MAEPATRRMTLDEFLRWEDGTDTRYELVGGYRVAMALPARAHGILCNTLGALLRAALRDRPECRAQVEAGIAHPERSDTCFIADLAVACRPHQRGEQLIEDPILIVEILSPGTERHDRRTKLPAYRQIGSVEDTVLLDSESLYAEVLRREGEHWITTLVRGQHAVLRLQSLDLSVSMSELYEGIDIGEDAEDRSPA